MTEKRYSYWALVLMAAVVSVTYLPKIPAVKSFIDLFPLDPIPAVWSIMALSVYFLLPRAHVPGRLRSKGQVYGAALPGAVIFLALRFGVGFLLKSVAASPYDLSPAGIAVNLLGVVPAIAACEMVRAYALGTAYQNPGRTRIWIPLIILTLCLLEVNFSKIPVLRSTEEWFVFVAKDVLPVFAQSCLLTVLALCGGARAAVIYSAVIGVFTRIFPYLPTLPWIAEAALGITFPAIMALSIWGRHGTGTRKQTAHRQENLGLFTASLVVTVAFAWFVAGVFPVYPSVILTGSMEPEIYPGDVVLIRKFTAEKEIYSLSENDVVNYDRQDITINHRIVEVLRDQDGNISFQTKGDNNKTADQTVVLPEHLNGIIKWVVPKAGLPVLWLRGSDPVPEGVFDIETD